MTDFEEVTLKDLGTAIDHLLSDDPGTRNVGIGGFGSLFEIFFASKKLDKESILFVVEALEKTRSTLRKGGTTGTVVTKAIPKVIMHLVARAEAVGIA